jgi:hypothetical protein
MGIYNNLWTGSLNIDGQQFHQYQQNGQPPLTSNHQPKYKSTRLGKPGPGLGQTRK